MQTVVQFISREKYRIQVTCFDKLKRKVKDNCFRYEPSNNKC